MGTASRFFARFGFDANSLTITNVATPVNGTDAANKTFASDAGNLTTGTLLSSRMPAFSGDFTTTAGSTVATLASVTTANTGTKITYNAKGLVTGSTSLSAGDIPDLSATYQPKNTTLTNIAAVTLATGNLRYNGSSWVFDGTTYQTQNATLTSLAALSTVTTGIIKLTNGVASLDTGTYLTTATATPTITSTWTFSNTISGSISGNAATTTKLATARNITFTVDGVSRAVSFDGSADVSATAFTSAPAWGNVSGKPTTAVGMGLTDVVLTTGNTLPMTNGQVTTATATTSSVTAGQVLDTAAIATYRTVEWMIQVTSGTSYHCTEVQAIHDGTTAYYTQSEDIVTGSSLATFDVDISGGNLRLLVTPAQAASTTFKMMSKRINV